MDIEKVAKLARIELSEDEKTTLGKHLDGILEYMELLNQVGTTGVQSTSHPIPINNAFRDDQLIPCVPREEVISIAPDQEAGYFKVPRIIE